MLFPSCFLRKTLLTPVLASQKNLPSELGSPSYLVVEEGAGAEVELVEKAEEQSPQKVGLEPAGPGQRVACLQSTLQGLPGLGLRYHPWIPGPGHLAPGGIGAGRPPPFP